MFIRHVGKLTFRVLLLAAALFLYFTDSEKLNFISMPRQGFADGFLYFVWITLVVGMLYRIFPNKRITLGARKHFACSYKASPLVESAAGNMPAARKQLHKGAFLCAAVWIVFNAAIFLAFRLPGILTPATALIIMLFYSVCDVVCILFFCPFRVFFMRNRCCAVCRIYNWDYLMMCTPMVLFPHVYSISLVLISVIVLLRWEISLHNNPHFFITETNETLRCELCEDKLCLLRNRKAGKN